MSDAKWSGLDAVNSPAMPDARRQALNVVQWLVRIAQSYGPEGAPIALRWDGDIVTPEFGRALSVTLSLHDLSLSFREDGRPVPHRLDVDDRSPAQVEAWFLVEMLHRDIDRTRFSLRLPYEVPDLITGDAQEYATGPYREELATLARLYAAAAAALKEAARAAGASAPEVVCLPYNLHLVVDAGDRRFGFSPGDDANGGPRFYVAGAGGSSGQPERVLPLARALATAEPERAIAAFFAEGQGPVRH